MQKTNYKTLVGNTSRKETVQMVKYFAEHHKRKIETGHVGTGQKNDPINVAYCCWFNLDPLIGYLQELKSKQGADGLRIYFGAHGKGHQYYGFNNVILVGTQNIDDENQDLPEDKFKDEVAYAYTVGGSKLQLDDYDNAHLCPPTCDCGENILCDAVGSYDPSCTCQKDNVHE